MIKVLISLICVASLAILVSRKFKISGRYDRVPRTLSQWGALDKGIDPTENDPTENDPTENDPTENDPTENDPTADKSKGGDQ